MAVFNNGNQSSKEHNNTTIITEGSFIKGEMELSCALYIDGNFEGAIRSSASVTVGRNGKIDGDVLAKKLVIQGTVKGSAEADRIEIHADGKMEGSVTSSELVIEAQAVFEGDSHFKARETSKTKTKKPEQLPKSSETPKA